MTLIKYFNINVKCALLMLLLISANNAKSQCYNPIIPGFSTNGPVNSTAYDSINEILYIGGRFDIVNLTEASGALLNDESGKIEKNWPKFKGSVGTAISDGLGGMYVGGRFKINDEKNYRNLVHIAANGSVDNFTPTFTSKNSSVFIYCIEKSNDNLFIGGTFDTINGKIRNNFACYDISGDSVSNLIANTNSSVVDICVSDSLLYFGGWFTSVNNQSRNYIASINLDNKTLTSWKPNANDFVNTIIKDGNVIYVSGSFTKINNIVRNHIASLNSATGLLLPWNPNIASNEFINDMVVTPTSIFVAGKFSFIGGNFRSNLAQLSKSTAILENLNLAINGAVQKIILTDSILYFTGTFTQHSGGPSVGFAAYDLKKSSYTKWTPAKTGSYLRTMDFITGKIFIGGDFSSIGIARSGVAALDPETGEPNDFIANADAIVDAIFLQDTILYIGGFIRAIGTTPRNLIAAVNSKSGKVLPWNPNMSAYSSNYVSCIVASEKHVFIGGSYSSVGGQSKTVLCSVNANDGKLTKWGTNLSSSRVYVLALNKNKLYIGSSSGISVYDTSASTPLSWNPNPMDGSNKGIIEAIFIKDTIIYFGGTFTSVNSQEKSNIAAVSEAGKVLPFTTTFNSIGNRSVYALYEHNNVLYAGGDFSLINNTVRYDIAALNSSTGQVLAWNPKKSNYIHTSSFSMGKNKLFIGGDISFADDTQTSDNISAFSLNTTNPAIIASADSIVALEKNAVYRWVDCANNNSIISNETNDYFLPKANGSYAVYVTKDYCSVKSSCYNFLSTSTEIIRNTEDVIMYPNPANNYITLSSSSTPENILIYDYQGKKISEIFSRENVNYLDISKFANGIYFVCINFKSSSKTLKLIKY